MPAPALDNPSQGGLPPTAGGGTGPTTYNMYLQNDKAARLAALMERLGLGSMAAQNSAYGDAVGGAAAQLLDPWALTQGMAFDAQGNPTNVYDNYSGLIDKFVGYLRGAGGMGKIADDARNASRLVSTDPRYTGLKDKELIAMLQNFSQLANLPGNSWLQRAYGNLQDQSVAQYYRRNDPLAQGGQTPVNYLPFINDNPIFRFITGRQ